ncbi:hypothetical protein ACOMHN_015171 [Nucella lapillus]
MRISTTRRATVTVPTVTPPTTTTTRSTTTPKTRTTTRSTTRTPVVTTTTTTQVFTRSTASSPTTTTVWTTTTEAPKKPAICDNCTMVNGVGYKAHWAHCDLFLQCEFLPDGSVTVHVKQCPHGLHWDTKTLTCNRPQDAACSMGE